MISYNPIKNDAEYNQVCKANLDTLIRAVEYRISELDSGWRNLSRKETDIRKHQLKFLEDLVTSFENASVNTFNTGVNV